MITIKVQLSGPIKKMERPWTYAKTIFLNQKHLKEISIIFLILCDIFAVNVICHFH